MAESLVDKLKRYGKAVGNSVLNPAPTGPDKVSEENKQAAKDVRKNPPAKAPK
jgi:hypothetical protein